MTPAISAIQVANEFLPLGWGDRSVPVIDQMKLQKLLFYTHAWHLGIRGTPLFEDDFEAWPWGPVVKDVYYQTKDYRRGEVTALLTTPTRQADGTYKLSAASLPDSCEDAKAFVRSVWDTHKVFSGIQLSNATHRTGEPWTVIKELYGSLDNKPVIPNDLIRDIFRKKMPSA